MAGSLGNDKMSIKKHVNREKMLRSTEKEKTRMTRIHSVNITMNFIFMSWPGFVTILSSFML